jgi:hypothetical protein
LITGFSRVLGLVHVLAFASWAVIVVVWALAIYQGGEQKLWPYTRIYEDPATLLLAFICLGAPIVSFAFSLPFHAVRFVLAGFLNLDDEGVPQGDWLLFRVFGFILTEAIPYLSKVLGWAIVLGALYAVHSNRSIEAVLTYVVSTFNFEDKDMPYLQTVAHGLVIVGAIAIRFALWTSVGFRMESWLERLFQTRMLGETRTKAVLDYANAIAEREGVFPAIRQLFSASRRAA